ncbi:MAG: hypothetical protein LBM99_02875 [Bacillales bacterium]|jgi:hypothetical protein|nr:hypothetical protein [Bacillales bacterium]
MSKLNKYYKILGIVVILMVFLTITIYIVGDALKLSSTDSSHFRTLITYVIEFIFLRILFKVLDLKQIKFPLFFFVLLLVSALIDILGENFAFYQIIPICDVIGHFISGLLFFFLSVVGLEKVYINSKMHPLIFVLLCISVSLSFEIIWELLEYSSDYFTHSNMLRAINSLTGEAYVGLQAVQDTMEDILLCLSGCLVGAITVLIGIKKNKLSLFTLQTIKQNN